MNHHELVKAVAAALGATANIKDTNDHFGAIEGAAVVVGIYHDTHRKRLSASVVWPYIDERTGGRYTMQPRNFLSGADYSKTPTSEISVSAGRDPVAIAKDIKRRLIEPNAALFQQALEQIEKSKAATKARNDMAAALVAQFPRFYLIDKDNPANARNQRGYYHLPHFRCSDDVHVESFNCSPAVAAEVLAVLTKHAHKED